MSALGGGYSGVAAHRNHMGFDPASVFLGTHDEVQLTVNESAEDRYSNSCVCTCVLPAVIVRWRMPVHTHLKVPNFC
jgi:hypothetical protein